MTIADANRRRAMAAGFAAIALWGALAALSVSAGPIPPFQMVAMTFAVGASIGIVRALARGVGWRGLVGLADARLAARRRRAVRLPRALLRRPPACPAGRGQPGELSVAVADRAAVGAARRRAPGLAASARRLARLCRRRPARLRPRLQLHRRTMPWAMRWRWAAPSPGRSTRCCRAASARRRPTPSPPSVRRRRCCRSSAISCSSARCGPPRRRRGSPCWRSASAPRAPRSISGTTPSSAATSARWARSPMPRRSCRRRC